jgi:hypothetical protein
MAADPAIGRPAGNNPAQRLYCPCRAGPLVGFQARRVGEVKK